MQHNPHEALVPGIALVPQNINTTPVVGATILRPWELGRYITFIAIAAAFAASDSITINVEARRKGTSTWDDVTESDGSTALAFDAEADGGDLENGHVFGTLDLERFEKPNAAYEYDAIRIAAVNGNAANVIVGACYFISKLYTYPAKDASGNLLTDGLLIKQLPFTNV